MAAITWRNVGGGDTSGALRNLMAAGQSVTSGFDSLRGVVKDAEAADRQNMARLREKNTNVFLDALQARYTTPEAMQAAIASGEVEQFRQSFGTNIDPNATRGAADARANTLRQQATSNMQFNNQMTDDRDQAALSRAQAAAYSADPQVRAAAQEEMANISDRNKGKAVQNIFQAERDLFGFGVEKNKEQRAGEAHKMDLRKGEASIQASQASAAASRASAANSAVRTALAQVELGDAQQTRAFQKGIQQEIRNHHIQTAAEKDAINKVAAANPGMAVLDKKGNVDPTRMNAGQLDAFEALLNTQKLSLNAITGSDTAAQERLLSKLYQAGAPLAVIDKVKAGGDWFNTSAPAPIGNDAATKARKEYQQQQMDQKMFDAAGGVPLKSGDFAEAMKLIGPSLPSDKNGGADLKKAASDYFTKGGVDIDGVKRYLPANTVAQILAGRDEKSWYDLGTTRSTAFDALIAAEKDFADKLKGVVDTETNKKVRGVLSATPITKEKRKQ